MTREELEAELEYHKLLDALAAAKKGKDRDKLHEAKLAVYAHRQQTRGALPDAVSGEARPATLAVKTKVKGN